MCQISLVTASHKRWVTDMYDKVYRAYWHGTKGPSSKEVIAETPHVKWCKRDLICCRKLHDNKMIHFRCHDFLRPESDMHRSVRARKAEFKHQLGKKMEAEFHIMNGVIS